MGKRTKIKETCTFCQGTGKIATYWTNPDTHMQEPDGEEDCVCQFAEEYDETPEDEDY